MQLADAFARVGAARRGWKASTSRRTPSPPVWGPTTPTGARKLLLHRAQLDKLGARIAQEQLTLVPLAIYFKDGRAKVELALARGRRKGDHRQAMAERDANREVARALGRQRKGMTD